MNIQHLPTHHGPAVPCMAFCLGLMLCLPCWVISEENVINCQPNEDTFIQYGDIVDCSIENVGDSDLARFSGSIGETILVQTSILAGNGNPFVDLFAPDGMRIGGGLNPFQITLEQAGPHTIQVTEFANNSTVDYALTVERVAPPSPTARQTQYGPTLNDGIHPIVDIDPFFFEATADDTTRTRKTDVRGCYKFKKVISDKKFRVTIKGPVAQ